MSSKSTQEWVVAKGKTARAAAKPWWQRVFNLLMAGGIVGVVTFLYEPIVDASSIITNWVVEANNYHEQQVANETKTTAILAEHSESIKDLDKRQTRDERDKEIKRCIASGKSLAECLP